MKEYIERDLVLNHLSCNQEIRFFRVADADGTWVSARDVIRTINKIPAADVVERKRGEWIPYSLELQTVGFGANSYTITVPTSYECSLCGRVSEVKEPFCHCGADMRSHQDILCDQRGADHG